MVSLVSFVKADPRRESFCGTPPTATRLLFMFCCLSLMFSGGSAANTLRCWNGVSNPKASVGYPPEETECSTAGLVCQLTYVASLNLYSMSCSTNATCTRLLGDLTAGRITNLYDHVKCCNESRCNAAPDMPNSGIGGFSSDINFHWSILILVIGLHFMRSSFFDEDNR